MIGSDWLALGMGVRIDAITALLFWKIAAR